AILPMLDDFLHADHLASDHCAARGHTFDERERHPFVMGSQYTYSMLHQQCRDIIAKADKPDLILQAQLQRQALRGLHIPFLATASELHDGTKPPVAQHCESPQQGGMILL